MKLGETVKSFVLFCHWRKLVSEVTKKSFKALNYSGSIERIVPARDFHYCCPSPAAVVVASSAVVAGLLRSL